MVNMTVNQITGQLVLIQHAGELETSELYWKLLEMLDEKPEPKSQEEE